MRNKNLICGTKSQLQRRNNNLPSTEQTTATEETIIGVVEQINNKLGTHI
jgi:hypothetical protein